MASPRRVTVVDNLCSRKQVRELLGIRDARYEQPWKKFEQQSFNAFRFDGFDLDPTQKWLHLPSKDSDTTIAEMRRLYQKFGPEAPISEEDLNRLAEWRAYNLHKTDRKRFMDKNIIDDSPPPSPAVKPQPSNQPEQRRSLMYDPVKERFVERPF